MLRYTHTTDATPNYVDVEDFAVDLKDSREGTYTMEVEVTDLRTGGSVIRRQVDPTRYRHCVSPQLAMLPLRVGKGRLSRLRDPLPWHSPPERASVPAERFMGADRTGRAASSAG